MQAFGDGRDHGKGTQTLTSLNLLDPSAAYKSLACETLAFKLLLEWLMWTRCPHEILHTRSHLPYLVWELGRVEGYGCSGTLVHMLSLEGWCLTHSVGDC